jgi:hypothetical protein
MFKSCCFAAAILAVAMPALADGECGSPPVAPAIPTVNDFSGMTLDAAAKARHEAFLQIKVYQGALQPYRACLEAQDNADVAAIADAKSKGDKEKDKIQPLQDRIAARLIANNRTVDTEQQVAAEFNTLAQFLAQCAKDSTPSNCPKN